MKTLNRIPFINLSAYKKILLKPAFTRPGGCSTFYITLILLVGRAVPVQAQERDYGVHANIIYRFTKYIDWPENRKSGDFVIGIVGESPLYDYLKTFVVNKTVGNQKIIVKNYSSSDAVFNCHILFISESQSSSLKKIVIRTAGMPILLVTEEEGLAHKGSCINFIIVDDRLKLEINKTNIEQRHLDIATELLSLGIIIK